MASRLVEALIETFEDWIEEYQKIRPRDLPLRSYEEAHDTWMSSGAGLDAVGCSYSLAVEMLLELLSRSRVHQLPLVAQGDEDHVWEHMREAEFRKSVYDWQLDQARRGLVRPQTSA